MHDSLKVQTSEWTFYQIATQFFFQTVSVSNKGLSFLWMESASCKGGESNFKVNSGRAFWFQRPISVDLIYRVINKTRTVKY